MLGIGVIEGFFGPEWSWSARHHFCENLTSYGGHFYIYAPKRDPYLRKSWMQDHPAQMWNEIQKISLKCQSSGVAFGLGLSPFEIHDDWNAHTQSQLRDKLKKLQELDFKYLGLFFDDMKGAPDLAEKQIEIVEFVKNSTNRTILFCPTYYSDDPILDKVFGQRPPGYLEKIATLPHEVQILWTGRKVIPNEISSTELAEVSEVLKRKPFIWDNYFANDGPKQCKFLKLKPLLGRSPQALENSAGWALNLMNQAQLSEILFAASVRVLRDGDSPEKAFQEELGRQTPSQTIEKYREEFLTKGLDGLDEGAKKNLIQEFKNEPIFHEVVDWLEGQYLVGPECLTD